jgi:hypothetical protein
MAAALLRRPGLFIHNPRKDLNTARPAAPDAPRQQIRLEMDPGPGLVLQPAARSLHVRVVTSSATGTYSAIAAGISS